MQKSSQGESEWPYCKMLDGTCLVFEADRQLGKDVGAALLGFIFSAEDGARITLQKNREGFTLQVTGAVQRGKEEPIDLAEARELRRRLDMLRGNTG